MMEKLRVLQVIPDLSKGGAERLTLDICAGLSKMDTDVRLVNFRNNNDYDYLSSGIRRDVIPARFIPSVTGKPAVELEGLKKYLQEFQPHVIHSHLFEAEMVTRQIILPGVKYFTHLHDNMRQFRNFTPSDLFNRQRLAELYEKRLMINRYRQCNNRFIAISRHTADFFTKTLPKDLRSITVLHNAIDYARFRGKPSSVPTRESTRLVSTGSLVDKKNQIFLVNVVKELKRRGVNVHLDILGEGANYQNIKQKIELLNLGECITLRGNVERVEEFLQRAHIYVHSATYEPFGLALLEAMAAGLPCVMLDGKGNRDIAEDGRNGYWVEVADPAIFSEKLMQLIGNPDAYRKISDYAHVYAARFDIGEYADKLFEIYQ